MTAIQVRGLRKSYGAIEAVRGIDLDVAEGEVFGLLGPNGAGKTTTVEILEGYRPRSAGEVTVLGHDPAKAPRDLKERIGVVLQETGVERYLNVTEVVDLYRGYYRKSRPTDELLALTGLEAQRDQRVKTLSGGQKRRLDLALALAGDPELLFLDEPTTGFDPSARRGAWDVIKGLRELGTTILLTTHYMDEAQVLADRVAVIVGGVIVAEGPPDNLAGSERATEIHFTLPPGTGADALPELTPPATVRVEGGAVLVTVPDPTQALNTLTGWALSRSLTLPDLTVTRPRLEDVYLELTKEAPRPVSDLAIAARQVKFEQKAFWRNPAAAVFTFAFPLMFLFIFSSLNSGGRIDTRGGITFVTFFVPGIAAFGIISACYTNIAMRMAIARDLNILKRVKGTPVPPWAYLAGQIGSSIVTTVQIVAVTIGAGVLVFGVDFRWDTVGGLLATVALGAACFCALGLAISGLCPNGDAAPAIVNFSIFPLIFISGIFFPLDDAPSWLTSLAKMFPIQHLANGLQYAFDPRTAAPGVNGGDLAVLAAWTVIGSVLALRLFKWENDR